MTIKRNTPLKRSPIRRRSESPAAKERRRKDAEWRRCVLEQCGDRCARCGGKAIDAHHIKGKQAYPLLRHIIGNGVALCRGCHRWVHDHPQDAEGMISKIKTGGTHG